MIAGLPVGRYTVTATAPPPRPRTSLVTVAAGGAPTRTSSFRKRRRDGRRLTVRVQVTPDRVELGEATPSRSTSPCTTPARLIGGYHLRVLGADPSWVTLETENLSLFPDASETVRAWSGCRPGSPPVNGGWPCRCGN